MTKELGISKDFAHYLKEKGLYSNYIVKLKKYGYKEAAVIYFGAWNDNEQKEFWKGVYIGFFEYLKKKYPCETITYN